jgi:hypothetical protein
VNPLPLRGNLKADKSSGLQMVLSIGARGRFRESRVSPGHGTRNGTACTQRESIPSVPSTRRGMNQVWIQSA